jgi:hypothetical protein
MPVPPDTLGGFSFTGMNYLGLKGEVLAAGTPA